MPVDFFAVKGIIEDLLQELEINEFEVTESQEVFYQIGNTADFGIKGVSIGNFGKLDPKIAGKFELEQPIYIFDINLDQILDNREYADPRFKEISKFPPVLRDLSFLIPGHHQLQDIVKTMYEVNQQYLDKIVVFDEYTGKNIKEGYRSLSFNLVFVSSTKTLTDEYITNIINKIIKVMQQEYQVKLR